MQKTSPVMQAEPSLARNSARSVTGWRTVYTPGHGRPRSPRGPRSAAVRRVEGRDATGC